jgi:hypothetical protein
MARTLTKQKPVREEFIKGLVDIISTPTDSIDYDDTVWREKPVDIETWCEKFLNEPLFPIQAGFCEAMVGNKPTKFSTQYEEGHAFWGKGSGKDRTIAKLQIYLVYKLMCLKNPQDYLREEYRCSLGVDAPIDLGNISINARQARNVYFKNLKSVVLNVKNPKTKRNWFKEQGVDLRDGYDIQNEEIRFPHNITAHSLNSETHTGEGLQLMFAAIDEFGAFPLKRAFDLRDAITDTVTSRFGRIGKTCVFSYKYYNNDPMHILYEKEKDNKNIYTSKAATFEVNLMRSKSDFANKYLKNPEKAKMTYECEGGEKEGGYVSKKYMIDRMFSNDIENPIKGNLFSVESDYLHTIQFKEWFKPDKSRIYAVRFDTAKGKTKERGDAAGFAMGHTERMKPKVDEKLRKDLAKEGIVYDVIEDSIRKGIFIDLALQITAPDGGEIELSMLRKFVMRLKNIGFNIAYVSYDGWQSLESVQLLKSSGIDASQFSVDKNNEAYDNWKELMYQSLFQCYYHPIAHREARELIMNSQGKVDHPEESWERESTEGVSRGSKDVMDSIVGVGKQIFDEINLEADIYFG